MRRAPWQGDQEEQRHEAINAYSVFREVRVVQKCGMGPLKGDATEEEGETGS